MIRRRDVFSGLLGLAAVPAVAAGVPAAEPEKPRWLQPEVFVGARFLGRFWGLDLWADSTNTYTGCVMVMARYGPEFAHHDRYVVPASTGPRFNRPPWAHEAYRRAVDRGLVKAPERPDPLKPRHVTVSEPWRVTKRCKNLYGGDYDTLKCEAPLKTGGTVVGYIVDQP